MQMFPRNMEPYSGYPTDLHLLNLSELWLMGYQQSDLLTANHKYNEFFFTS